LLTNFTHKHLIRCKQRPHLPITGPLIRGHIIVGPFNVWPLISPINSFLAVNQRTCLPITGPLIRGHVVVGPFSVWPLMSPRNTLLAENKEHVFL